MDNNIFNPGVSLALYLEHYARSSGGGIPEVSIDMDATMYTTNHFFL